MPDGAFIEREDTGAGGGEIGGGDSREESAEKEEDRETE